MERMFETTEGTGWKKGLEFGPRTTDDCKRLVGRLHKPADLLAAYRTARVAFGTGDIVLSISDQVPHIEYTARPKYIEHLKQLFGEKGAAAFTLSSESAHRHMKLPSDSDAMWLVVDVKGADLPSICVIYATPHLVDSN